MSSVLLSVVELNSAINYNGKCDENEISETSIEIDSASIASGKVNSNSDSGIHSNADNAHEFDGCESSRQRSPTTNSVGSNNISIVTLDDDEDDSSVIDSDSDVDNVINCNENDYRSASGVVLVSKNLDPPNFCQSSTLCANNDAKPNIGSIAVQNSSDITFGNKTFYQGPVTIKQFVYDKNKWKETEPPESDNLGYENSSTDPPLGGKPNGN